MKMKAELLPFCFLVLSESLALVASSRTFGLGRMLTRILYNAHRLCCSFLYHTRAYTGQRLAFYTASVLHSYLIGEMDLLLRFFAFLQYAILITQPRQE